jgi:hypothetical protein
MREVDEALKAFSYDVRRHVNTRDYGLRNSGTLRGLRDRATRCETRTKRAQEIAVLVGLDLCTPNLCEESIAEFVAGWTGELQLACSFRRQLDVQSLPAKSFNVATARAYVLKGGDFAAVARQIMGVRLSVEDIFSKLK